MGPNIYICKKSDQTGFSKIVKGEKYIIETTSANNIVSHKIINIKDNTVVGFAFSKRFINTRFESLYSVRKNKLNILFDGI